MLTIKVVLELHIFYYIISKKSGNFRYSVNRNRSTDFPYIWYRSVSNFLENDVTSADGEVWKVGAVTSYNDVVLRVGGEFVQVFEASERCYPWLF